METQSLLTFGHIPLIEILMNTSITRDLLAKSTDLLMQTNDGDMFTYDHRNTNQVEQSLKGNIENLEQKQIIEEAYAYVQLKTKPYLDPLWKELAEIVAKCHYNKSKNPSNQKLRRVEVNEMVIAIGSDMLCRDENCEVGVSWKYTTVQ